MTLKNLTLTLSAVLLLTSCASSRVIKAPVKPPVAWKVAVNLTPEQRLGYEKQIQELTQSIRNWQPTTKDPSVYAPVADYLDLARAYTSLGEYDLALQTYQEGLRLHKQSQAMVHNIGRLYETVGDYEEAVKQYRILIKDYNEPNYAYDITWAYIRAGDRKKAEKAFNEWQLAMHKTDLQTQEAIKKLREKEGAGK